MSNYRQYKLGTWYQIDGDINPAKDGCTLGRLAYIGLRPPPKGEQQSYDTEILCIDNMINCCGTDALQGSYPFAATTRIFSDCELRRAFCDRGWLTSCDVHSWLRNVWPEAYTRGAFNPEARLTHAARFAIAESVVSYSGGETFAGGPEVCPARFTSWHGRSGRRAAGFYEEAACFAREKRDHQQRG